MTFKGRSDVSPEQIEKLEKEILTKMATLDDLFGGKKKRPASPRWNVLGDKHDAVVTEEPYTEQQVEIGGSYEKLFLEEDAEGKWSVKKEGELTDGNNRSPLMQIVVPVELLDGGREATFYFSSQTERKALREAMEAGVPLIPGTGIRKAWTHNEGKRKGWTVKLAAPKE